MKKLELKRFIVRKYIMARTANEALKIERKYHPDDVWVDEDWKKEKGSQLSSCIGFSITKDKDYEY